MTISPSGPNRPSVDKPIQARGSQPVLKPSDEPSSGPATPVASRPSAYRALA